ncbi:Smr/MutS family protein [Bartonella vinsonii]|uniref:Smr family protein n=1 Tax=Bartonella vinsonii subsp. berkhoffii str. Tweed TaxID=1094502 RepID=N6USZ0_BARVB|nr:Smr/MutS family protein [Bartonella vinsonii]AGF75252.1 Smr family protein [Bartonella vinsonii subsp. berkhoffii str. Winnie]ENN95444.1 Smr family protein [Bartonella vinsonii subsp. berkhoffii str. Tweed]
MSTNQRRQKRDLLASKDRFLWEMVCRTTIPLHNNNKPYSFLTKETENIDNKKQQGTPLVLFSQGNQQKPTMVEREKATVTQAHKVHFFDRVVHHKLAKGHYPLEARLDLHGYMQEEAYFFLKKFLQSSQRSRLRYVLVITGKGRIPGSDGVLYRLVPHWLSTPAFRYYVHAFEYAARHHGGRGALYIWLRRFVMRKEG